MPRTVTIDAEILDMLVSWAEQRAASMVRRHGMKAARLEIERVAREGRKALDFESMGRSDAEIEADHDGANDVQDHHY